MEFLSSKASHNDLSCYHNTKYLETLKKQAGACLITKQFVSMCLSVIPLIVSHPYRAFGKIATLFTLKPFQEKRVLISYLFTLVQELAKLRP